MDLINNSTIGLEAPSVSKVILDLLSAIPTHEISVAVLCQAAELFGIAEQSTRVALTRLVKSGKVIKKERGIYAMDPSSNSLFRVIHRWLDKEQAVIEWDGCWLAVVDSALNRQDRKLLRAHSRALDINGFKPLKDSFYIRPNNLVGGIARLNEELKQLGLANTSCVFKIDQFLLQDEQRARTLWNVKKIREGYKQMLAELSASNERLDSASVEAGAVESLLLGRAIIRDIVRDPLLPDELLKSEERTQLIGAMRDYKERSKTLWGEIMGF